MLGGSISKKGKLIEGTYQQHAWHDSWESEFAITFDGELTPEVCAAIRTAWQNHQFSIPSESSWGKLRWMSRPSFVRIDPLRRSLIASESQNLCD